MTKAYLFNPIHLCLMANPRYPDIPILDTQLETESTLIRTAPETVSAQLLSWRVASQRATTSAPRTNGDGAFFGEGEDGGH